MPYIIIAAVDENGVPSRVNEKDTLEEADALVKKLREDMPPGEEAPQAFHKFFKQGERVQPEYLVVAMDAQTVTINEVAKTADRFAKLRDKRNGLLEASDWYGVSDLTMSDAWKTYRQALRDLPANTPDPANPIWPIAPQE
jgi:hypothetical protein